MSETYALRFRGHNYRIDKRIPEEEAKGMLRGKPSILVIPKVENEPCPFEPGEKITLVRHQLWIEIQKVTDKPKAGVWRVRFLLCDHRPVFMHRTGGGTREHRDRIGTGHLSGGNLKFEDDYEGDFQDVDAARREVVRIDTRRAMKAEDEVRARDRAARAKLQETLAGLPLEAQSRLLAEIEKACERAVSGELQEAA